MTFAPRKRPVIEKWRVLKDAAMKWAMEREAAASCRWVEGEDREYWLVTIDRGELHMTVEIGDEGDRAYVHRYWPTATGGGRATTARGLVMVLNKWEARGERIS